MTIIRRTLLKQAGAGAFALSRPALLTSTALLGVERPAAASGLLFAKAVQFLQGVYNSKYGTLIYQDADKLNFPLYANRIFFQTYIQLLHYMPPGYPGKMTIMSLTDGNGEPRFAINLLPPSNLIPGSTGSNPMLQIFGAADPSANTYFSYTVPDIISIDSTARMPWYTLQATVGMLTTTPARWIVSTLSVNQATTNFNSNLGFFTDPTGLTPLPSQMAPAVFNIPTQRGALGPYVFSLGMPITSVVGVGGGGHGYQPIGGASAYYDTLAANMAGTSLHLTPPINPDISVTLPQFLQLNNSPPGVVMTTSFNNAMLKASTIGEYLYQLQTPNIPISLDTFNQVKSQMPAAVSAVSLAATAAARAGVASTSIINQHLTEALQYANATQTYINAGPTTVNIANAAATGIALTAHLASALRAANQTMANATNLPTISTPTTPTTINISGANTSTGTVVLDGNGMDTTTNVATGTVVASSDGSYLNNQVNNVTLQSPQGQAPQQATQGPQVNIESIVITPTIP